MMTLQIPFGKRPVGGNLPVFIVFEAGATHYGLESALRLVDVAADAGADAVKFQLVDAARLVPSKEVMFTYQALADRESGRAETVTESLQTILKRRELSRDEWRKVVEHCHARGIEFFSTATSVEDLTFLAELGASSVKIASGDIDFHFLMREAARHPWTVQIDTGSATVGEVEQAVDVLELAGCRKIIINHCPSGYPARADHIHLRLVQTLKAMFPYPVAFSDHSPGYVMDIAAVALGVDMLEKTITLDRTIRSPEHIMSLEPQDAAAFIQTVREVECGLGLPRKGAEETKQRNTIARRSLTLATDLPAGHSLTQADLAYVRPGTGLPPFMDERVIGRTLREDARAGDLLEWRMLD